MALNSWDYLRLQKRITASAQNFPPPTEHSDIVWHYTTATGLIGILESCYIRGTNYSFMNDSSEFEYGRRIATRVLREHQDNSRRNAFHSAIENSLEHFASQSETFLACFSSRDDDLSQWRGYGSGHDRFSLGLDPKELNEPDAPSRAVIYDVSKQEEILRAFLVGAWNDAERLDDDRDLERAAAIVAPHLFDIVCFYKDSSFADEQEWRVAKRLSVKDASSVAFRGDTDLQAYVPLCARPGRRLPLRKVRFLSTHPDRAAKFAGMILRKHGYGESVEVSPSTIPFFV